MLLHVQFIKYTQVIILEWIICITYFLPIKYSWIMLNVYWYYWIINLQKLQRSWFFSKINIPRSVSQLKFQKLTIQYENNTLPRPTTNNKERLTSEIMLLFKIFSKSFVVPLIPQSTTASVPDFFSFPWIEPLCVGLHSKATSSRQDRQPKNKTWYWHLVRHPEGERDLEQSELTTLKGHPSVGEARVVTVGRGREDTAVKPLVSEEHHKIRNGITLKRNTKQA